ncbi:ABC transporter substrate-binding protein [Actinobacteria bacterium YIM 96077]|uniref:ABC transporter substrate-binding protein n=1 Tax=Phytoactinopolyspora halophila TaxID=1981511 RepID=A0A329QMI2_9ACTN|nr:ABC transporter substrate-binding protein [Phytoactinopolyspora halophila]AYY12534.1 ABC transporter substrate-binding protein [Actinobacteria bacterium YIM 96077]RAW12562.1 ABC transporter substrate-binding protein [Phytoactinopolyspora halophila]
MRSLLGFTALTAAGALVLSACSEDGTAGGESGGTIVVGSVNTLSGSATFPEASEAAAAVFDAVNAEGGVNGYTIDYTIVDDKGDPAAAASAAREVVAQDEAVALVGSASLIECQVNADYYVQEDILSIPGIGVDPDCFTTPNIAPANVGPFHDMTLSLLYGSEELGLDNICALLEIAGNTLPAYKEAIQRWSDITGKELLYIDEEVPYGASDYTSYIVRAREAGCEAITVNPVEPDSIGQLKAAEQQGWDDVTWLLLTSVYSENYAEAVSETGNGVYVPAEFYPFTDSDSPETEEWRDLMVENDIDLTSFSQGGFLAATYFVEVLEGIEGDITRESVREALRSMEPIENPMVGTPYVFGPGDTHHDNTAGFPVQLQSGTNEWELAGDEWLHIPEEHLPGE